jgi:hypothetical protein
MSDTEEYLTVEELARRLNWAPKTVRNKMGPKGIFRKGVHYAEAPGLPVLFRWSAVLTLYRWESESPPAADTNVIPMARGYQMK